MADHARSDDPKVQRELDRLAALGPGRDILGLERIGALCTALGNPEARLPPTLHVAGTNGKGSTIAFLRAMLEADGRRIHVYTSPHLVRLNERMRLAGQLIDDGTLAQILAETLDTAEAHDIAPSFFEAVTAAAFLAFARIPADACLIEVGLGGRLDATNVLPHPAATTICALGIDHERFLLAPEPGAPAEPIERIAWEKAGIAKAGTPLITLAYPRPVELVIEEAAERAGAPLFARDRAWWAEAVGNRLHFTDPWGTLDLPLPTLAGAHQMDNAALAVATLRYQQRLAVDAKAIAAGIPHACWPARLQRLGNGPLTRLAPGCTIWVDGAHNANAATALADAIAPDAPVALIFGLMDSRAIDDVLGPLVPHVGKVRFVPIAGHAHHDPIAMARHARSRWQLAADPANTVEEALGAIAADPGAPRHILIAGSLYLAGSVLVANDESPS